MRRSIPVAILLGLMPLGGCTVVSATGAVVSAAGSAVGAAASATGAVIDTVAGDDDCDESQSRDGESC